MHDGESGAKGADGDDGEDGQDGSDGGSAGSCSVEDNGDGTKTIACDDGTSVVVSDGMDAPGAGCVDGAVPTEQCPDYGTQQLVVTPSVVVTEESAMAGIIEVHLAEAPRASTTVSLQSTAPGLVVVSPTTLTFSPANYSINQAVNVHASSDANLTDETVDVLVTALVAPTATARVLVQEDDLQDLVVTPLGAVQPAPGAVVVTEDALIPSTIGVSLQFQPEASKGVRVMSSSPSVLVNGQSFVDLLFTTSSYAVPQLLTLSTPSDMNLDQPADATLTVGLCSTACASAAFSATKRVNVDAVEDDVQSILIASSPVAVTEGSTNTFTVRLAFEPVASSTEVISLESTDSNACSVLPQTLDAFNAANYADAQTVTLTGVQDADVLNEQVTINLSSSHGGTPSASVHANVTDDDQQAVLLSSPASMLTEALGPGHTATVSVWLQQDPSGSLTVSAGSLDMTAVTVSPATLSFNSANYAVAQNFTITAAPDADIADEIVDVLFTAVGASDGVHTATVTDSGM